MLVMKREHYTVKYSLLVSLTSWSAEETEDEKLGNYSRTIPNSKTEHNLMMLHIKRM